MHLRNLYGDVYQEQYKLNIMLLFGIFEFSNFQMVQEILIFGIEVVQLGIKQQFKKQIQKFGNWLNFDQKFENLKIPPQKIVYFILLCLVVDEKMKKISRFEKDFRFNQILAAELVARFYFYEYINFFFVIKVLNQFFKQGLSRAADG
eukprot:TRINITY_DN13823_c0_g2_i2.p1 TRINITY_DN13823_c0_g2~~TRINITY_DN13823_c0_g2_i2.p1  ORF type:complete len:148 (-),score=22.11 TRINITY_DN13823_c0_g2_i2:6-449(-)